jgi:hypothetical protein
MERPLTPPTPASSSSKKRSPAQPPVKNAEPLEAHANDSNRRGGASPAEESSPIPPTPLTSGWYDFPDEVYHADPCPRPSLSASIANLIINKSLMHAWRAHPKSPVFEETTLGASADRGTAVHALLFGGRAIETIKAEDYRTAAAREARDEARAKGRIPILQKDLDGLAAMLEPARQRFAGLHGTPFLAEQTAIWRAGSAGWRRARLDTLSADRLLIVDYKTTEAAVDAFACERRIADMGLQIQAAAYVEAVETLHPELCGRVRFLFQWQEQKSPYALSPPIEMSEAFMALGRAQWQAASALWDKALKHRAFPGYSARPFPATPPGWELSRWEERARLESLPSGGSV